MSYLIALPLRLKILALASLLLVAFAITTAFSTREIYDIRDELRTIVDYQIALSALMSEVDVETDDYELNARRLSEASDDPERMRAIVARQALIAARLPKAFAEMKATLEAALRDPQNDDQDLIAFARMDATLALLGRNVPGFLAAGSAVQAAVEAGRVDDARRLVHAFRAYETAFGPDLAAVRRAISDLSRDSVRLAESDTRKVLWLNIVLFVIAAGIGLGAVAVLAHRLTGAFRRLLEGTRSVEAGELAVELPVTSRDEVGQLTQAFNHMIVELRGKEKIKETFGQFLDPRLITRVLGAEAKSGGLAERRIVTVFFSDIKAFSSLSEQLTADVLARMLNGYFTAMTKIIRARNGIVDKFIGDAVMAFWTPPFSPGDQHAADACLAALAQQAALGDFRAELSDLTGMRRNVPDFQVRMGIATGEVVVGTLGSETTKSYTVIGDTVNLASRLEGTNKLYGTSMIVSEDTYRLARQAVEARDLDLIVVMGKTEPVRIYELLAPVGELRSEVAELRGVFEEGLAAYRRQSWDVAERKLREALRLAPDDRPSQILLDRIAALQVDPPARDWNGVWAMEHK